MPPIDLEAAQQEICELFPPDAFLSIWEWHRDQHTGVLTASVEHTAITKLGFEIHPIETAAKILPGGKVEMVDDPEISWLAYLVVTIGRGYRVEYPGRSAREAWEGLRARLGRTD